MEVLLLSQWFVLLTGLLLQHPGDVAGQFTPAPPTCPDDTFTFTCNVTGDINGFTIWRLDSGRIPGSVCQLEHRSVSSGSFCGPESLFTADGGDGFGTDGPSFISTLYATASPRLNGMLVECFGPDGVNLEPSNLVGSGTVKIIAPPAAPRTPSVTFLIPRQQFTITWNEPPLSMGGTVDMYFVNISGPSALCAGIDRYSDGVNALQVLSSRSYTCSIQTPPQGGDIFTIKVAGASCGSRLRGPESEPLRLQVPNAPSFTFLPDCPGLAFVDIVWQNTGRAEPAVTTVCVNCIGVNCMSECRPVSGNNPFRINNLVRGANYTISLSLRNSFGQSGESDRMSYVNNDVRCSAPTPTSTSGLRAVVLPGNTVLCLLDGQPAASCSIRYGADPTYRVLPNTDSAVTGGVITLTSTLIGDTTYYIVSTTSGSLTTELRGSFTTCTTQDLMAPNTIVQPQSSCGEASGNIRLACYSGVTPGSTVTYRYPPGSLVSQSTRRCQSDGTWSGTTPNNGGAAVIISTAHLAILVILSFSVEAMLF